MFHAERMPLTELIHRNEDVDEEEWERAVIWDEAPPQAKRRKVPLVLDLNDAHMLFDKVSPMMTTATDA